MPDESDIAQAEKLTGIARATLRIWERRYGFPNPKRLETGARIYSAKQIRKLQLLAPLVAKGGKPNKLVQLSEAELEKLSAEASAPTWLPANREDQQLLRLLCGNQLDELAVFMRSQLKELGLPEFLCTRLAQWNSLIGQAWETGELAVFEEHQYSQSVQRTLHAALAEMSVNRQGPVVLLATFEQELHSLGLLMTQALFTHLGARCISLGVDAPSDQIVKAALAHKADIVGIGCAPSYTAPRAIRSLVRLRAELPEQVELWAGGSCWTGWRKPGAGIATFESLEGAADALRLWRECR